MFLKQPLLLFKTYVFFISIFHVLLYKGNSFDFNFIFNIYGSPSYIPIYDAEMAYMWLKKMLESYQVQKLFYKVESSYKIFSTSLKTFRLQASQHKLFKIHIFPTSYKLWCYRCLISFNLWSNFLIAKINFWYIFVEILVTFNICSILISSST